MNDSKELGEIPESESLLMSFGKSVKTFLVQTLLVFLEEIIFFFKILTIASTLNFTRPNFIIEFPFITIDNILTYPPLLRDRVLIYSFLVVLENFVKFLKTLN